MIKLIRYSKSVRRYSVWYASLERPDDSSLVLGWEEDDDGDCDNNWEEDDEGNNDKEWEEDDEGDDNNDWEEDDVYGSTIFSLVDLIYVDNVV